jgi:ADP-ribose pyrophosphatase
VPPEPVERARVFDGSLIQVEVETWADGVRREVVHHPGACGAVVLTGEQVVLVRQFREAVRQELLEIPAGIYDREEEPPEAAIRREIEEETGFVATEVEPLSTIFTSPGFADERIDLFLVRAEPGGTATEAGIATVLMLFSDALEEVRTGAFQDAKSALALLLAAHRVLPTA